MEAGYFRKPSSDCPVLKTHFLINKYKPVSHELVFSSAKIKCEMINLCTGMTQFYPRCSFLGSYCGCKELSYFLPSGNRREAGYSINTKPLYYYWRYPLKVCSTYLAEPFCINYLCCFPLNAVWARNLHMCEMHLGLQSNGPMSVRDSGSSYREDKHRDCALSFWKPP